jgi:hypothetical protein
MLQKIGNIGRGALRQIADLLAKTEREKAVGHAPGMENRALAEAPLLAQVALVLPTQGHPGSVLGGGRLGRLANPLVAQEPDKTSYDESGSNPALLAPAGRGHQCEGVRFIELVEGQVVRLHPLGEDAETTHVAPDRVLGIVLGDKVLPESTQLLAAQGASRVRNVMESYAGRLMHGVLLPQAATPHPTGQRNKPGGRCGGHRTQRGMHPAEMQGAQLALESSGLQDGVGQSYAA